VTKSKASCAPAALSSRSLPPVAATDPLLKTAPAPSVGGLPTSRAAPAGGVSGSGVAAAVVGVCGALGVIYLLTEIAAGWPFAASPATPAPPASPPPLAPDSQGRSPELLWWLGVREADDVDTAPPAWWTSDSVSESQPPPPPPPPPPPVPASFHVGTSWSRFTETHSRDARARCVACIRLGETNA
jgi:hypothetical protein